MYRFGADIPGDPSGAKVAEEWSDANQSHVQQALNAGSVYTRFNPTLLERCTGSRVLRSEWAERVDDLVVR